MINEIFQVNFQHGLTPVFFSMENKTTLKLAVLKTIHMHSSTSDTKRATMAVTMTTSGHQLPLTVIFKGETGGSIKRDEIPQNPADPLYVMQNKAYKVLSSYINT